MKIKLEIEASDALGLCKIHAACMEIASKRMGSMPLEYSKLARLTNNFLHEVVKNITPDEIDRIKTSNETD